MCGVDSGSGVLGAALNPEHSRIMIKEESVRINSTSGDFCSGFTSTTSESVSVVSLQQR